MEITVITIGLYLMQNAFFKIAVPVAEQNTLGMMP